MAFMLPHNFKAFINTCFLLLLCFFFTSHIRSPTTNIVPHSKSTSSSGCTALQELHGHHSKCVYLKTHSPCVSQGYINYLHMFYCLCENHTSIGHTLLALWLLVLFYILANTASQYFCSSVEGLSVILRLSPMTAGVTLLSLGNGSPDVFASIVSFRSGSAEVGLSSVLGGAFFISTVVLGIVNISAPKSRCVKIDRPGFVRDVIFFLSVLSSLFLILIYGRITVSGAACFASLYLVYVAIVSAMHFGRPNQEELTTPILIDDTKPPVTSMITKNQYRWFGWLTYVIDLPLYLPRRLTIPDVSKEHWSRTYAVLSAALAPVLLATLWNSKRGGMGTTEGNTIYLCAGLAGLALALISAGTTTDAVPPKKYLFPWLAGGFLMSVMWTYVIAEELVGLLVSLGYVMGISPGILGLTVLAWGNSIGDLIANVAMAVNGGQSGVQVAVSGCYAGPIFNTLAGLGVSLVVSAWGAHPDSFVIPVVPAVFEILGFMIGGLVWALVMLTRRGMELDRVVGVGLLAIYLCFLSLRLSQSLGMVIE